MALQPLTGRTAIARSYAQCQSTYFGRWQICRGRGTSGGDFARQLHLHAQFLKLPDGQVIKAPLPAHMKASLSYLELLSDVQIHFPF